MKLSNEQLKTIYYGALEFGETEDGYLQAFQYTKQQMKYFERTSDFWYDRCMASNAKTLEFRTTATSFSLEYKFIWVGSEDSIELMIDGVISQILYVKDLETEGMIFFNLPMGEKDIIVYLPADATILIRNFEINGDFSPASKRKKVLNQFETESMKDIEEYYIRLKELYKDTPVFCITPIWRGNIPGRESVFVSFCRKITGVCAKYSNITVVDGFKLVPHTSEYFLDNLHPNALGCEMYGRNLVLAIQEAGF